MKLLRTTTNGNLLTFSLTNRIKSRSIKMFLKVSVCNSLDTCNVFKRESRCSEICVERENDLLETLR